MRTAWQDHWTFRIVDQDSGAAAAGVPVTVLPDGGSDGGHWVSDGDGLVRVPKHDGARLRLRVGLRSEDAIELDARALDDEPVALAAPRGMPVATAPAGAARAGSPAAATPPRPGHLVRFARLAVLPDDHDVLATVDPARFGALAASPDAGALRYGVVLETELLWQSLGAEAGQLLYSVSLGPGEEITLVVSDGRWRKKPDARERPVEIVGRMVAARQLGDAVDALPLDPCVAGDLELAAAETVRYLADRTTRAAQALGRRPLGVTELQGHHPPGTTLRTVRNRRSEGVLSYHLVEPVERYQVLVRPPRLRPAMLVPFRLPNIATREVIRRFGHALRRSMLDRALVPDVEAVLAGGEAPEAVEKRLCGHIAAHLPYYSATIIAAGDPAERFFALAKLRDAEGRPLTDIIENTVVGRVGNYVVFPLRSLTYATPAWRAMLAEAAARPPRPPQELAVTLPIPGVWLRSELFPAHVAEGATETETPAVAPTPGERRKRA